MLVKGQSVLVSGEWYKVGVTETDIYKLDYDFLDNLGLNVNTLDPRTIKVYGNGGGGMLPQSNEAPRSFDLLENALFANGQADGSFDLGDYFLFYGRSSDKVEWTSAGLVYEKNLYADTTYYFITFGGRDGLRLTSQSSEAEQSEKIMSYDDAIIYESDENNLLDSGRKWYGEALSPASGLSTSFSFQIDHVETYELAEFHAMAQSEGDCSLAMQINGNTLGSIDFNSVPFGLGNTYSIKGSEASGIFTVSGSSDNIRIDFNFSPNGTTSIAYLDRFIVTLKRSLILLEEPLSFRSIESLNNPISSFQIDDARASMLLWDVTDAKNPISVDYTVVNGSAIFSVTTNILKEFVAFTGMNSPSPVSFGEVLNQSIKSTTSVDGIIVVHPDFLASAQRLADFHELNSDLSVEVVTTTEVYNEFSSGMQDVSAIRDYVKYVYETGGQLKYLLLFGDASYDYKNMINSNTKSVPIYESRNSLHPIFSYSSDDYFGFLESMEGEWIETPAGDHTMEIGVGRLPVKTREEAERVVNKIIRYSTSNSTLGRWRNEVLYIADDGDANVHARHAEDLSRIVDLGSGFNSKKIYLDAFEQEITPSRQRSPATTRAIMDAIESGAFLVNYIGHGNERLWMSEQVLTISEIEEFKNFQKLPIFVTATCEFGRYDDPLQFSGAEHLLLSDQGAIALLTTTRPVFSSTNFILNQAFHKNLLAMTLDNTIRLGDIIRQTKNNSLVGAVNRNFALLGDPMMRPAYPRFDIVLDQFQSVKADTLSALERVELTGRIVHETQTVSDFSGKLSMVLFDIATDKITIGQESAPYPYSEQDNALFRGEVTVANGEFLIAFVIPKNISYQYQIGKISMYGWDESSGYDAIGMSKNFVLGGTNEGLEDTTSPSLEVYFNEPSFQNGSTVGAGALLIAQFSDESGINISYLGFDRGITLDLNGTIIELNNFYSAETDDFTKGTVMYPLQDLEPGKYTALIKGSDTYNNSVTKTVQFVISDQPILQVYDFRNYPNPASTFTNFTFGHDREGESLQIDVLVYAMNGEQVESMSKQIDFSERSVTLRMDFASRINKDGLYLYRVIVRSLVDGAAGELVGRMIIKN